MTSIIRLLPLSGAKTNGPPCYLLQLDRFRFLLDCGLDENSSADYLTNLEPHIHHIDAILVSHPDLLHLGALPVLYGKLGLKCPIYATTPVYLMGQMFLYDLFKSRQDSEEFKLFTLDDVDLAFENVIQLKYSQTMLLKGRGRGISITPLPAGHMIGGTVWRIIKDGEEDIIYAVDYNHKKERHLNGCSLEGISRPSLFITDAYNGLYRQQRRQDRDKQLITTIQNALFERGNVLLVVDTAGRVLELAYMLDQYWRDPQTYLAQFPLLMLNNFGYNVIEFAKSHVEWMSGAIMKSFEGQQNNPFTFRYLQLCHKLTDLMRFPGPKVVIASPPHPEYGFSRDLLIEWVSGSNNAIIFTDRPSASQSLVSQLVSGELHGRFINLEQRLRIPLEGFELKEYRAKKDAENAEANKALAAGKLSESDTDSDSDDEQSASRKTVSASASINRKSSKSGASSAPVHDLMAARDTKEHKTRGFFKQKKKSFPMYPCIEERIQWDDYGEQLSAEELAMFDSTQGPDHNFVQNSHDANKENVSEVAAAVEIEIPTKCIKRNIAVAIQAHIALIDFEGRSDGDSTKKILSMMKPQRLILLRGSLEAGAALKEHASRMSGTERVFTPAVMESVDATVESSIYQVQLDGSLVSKLVFARAKNGAELAWVEGRISNASLIGKSTSLDFDSYIADRNLTGDQEIELPILEPLNLDDEPQEKRDPDKASHPTIFINELKLSDLKQVLIRNGIEAEFSGGVLHCAGDKVAIRRTEAGRITLEGTLCPQYFAVRQLLYAQYAII